MFKSIKRTATGQTTVLNVSLLWFAIGLTTLLGTATIFSAIPSMQRISYEVFSSKGLTVLFGIVAFGLMLAIIFLAHRVSIGVLIAMFFAIAIIEGFSFSLILYYFAFQNQTWKILLLLAIPAITMALMGFIGYKQIFDFSKIKTFLIVASIGLIVMGITMYFIPGIKLMWTIYCLLGYALFMLYVGFDLWRISKLDDVLRVANNPDKDIVLRYGIRFGLSLLIDFVQLVWFLARLLID